MECRSTLARALALWVALGTQMRIGSRQVPRLGGFMRKTHCRGLRRAGVRGTVVASTLAIAALALPGLASAAPTTAHLPAVQTLTPGCQAKGAWGSPVPQAS